jgi:Tfp pilus assembly protein PilX
VAHRRSGERGAALVLAILVLAILTVVGIALMLITSTESRIAANEWSMNRAFYSSDAGIRWAQVEMINPKAFLKRPEFTASAFGTVLFQLPSWRHGSSFFSGDTLGNEIQVQVQTPSLIGRRDVAGASITFNDPNALKMWTYEVRANGSQTTQNLQYGKTLVADVDLGPLPAGTPPQGQ